MCFSAEASFTAAALLVPAGAYCVGRTLRVGARFVPLALIPWAFSAQQVSEGVVWHGLHHGDPIAVQSGSVVFLFFALAFWPFWIPFSLLFVEPKPAERRVLGGLTLFSLVWLWLFAPLALDPDRWLAVEIMHHSVRYRFDELPAFQILPRMVWRVGYLAAICVPIFVRSAEQAGGSKLRLIGGLGVAGLFFVSALVFWYAFTSVWCFFAAILSLFLCVVFARLPALIAVQGVTPGVEAATGSPSA